MKVGDLVKAKSTIKAQRLLGKESLGLITRVRVLDPIQFVHVQWIDNTHNGDQPTYIHPCYLEVVSESR